MQWLVTILSISTAGLAAHSACIYFGRREAIEAATRKYRIAVRYAATRPSRLDAGTFINAWWRGNDVLIRRDFPDFDAFREAQVEVEEDQQEYAA
jgi:hypothetical protein